MKRLISTLNLSKEDWLRYRKCGITGTDAGAILGLNPYRSAFQVYHDKISDTTENIDNEAMRQGRDLEEYVAQRFTEATGLKVRRANAIYQSEEHPLLLADFDRLIVGQKAGLECKTVSPFSADKWADGKIPAHYMAQVNHYLAVSGFDCWYIAALIFGKELVIHKITTDKEVLNNLIAKEEHFRKYNVMPEISPVPTGSEGDADIYCPWDVISYLRDFQYGVAQKPKSYWKNTSDSAIIRSFIDYAGDNITTKLETLMAGGSIVQHIEENLTYDYLHSSEENLWSVLYLTGYLTKVRDKDLPDSLPDGCSALMIPNAEIREIFEATVSKWFDDSAKAWNRSPLFDAVWSGNSEALTKEMTKLLRMTISYHDYREDFYHAFLAGIFTGAGYVVESNKEHGEGRSDVIVKDIRNGRVAIFEAKYAKALDALPDACDTAIQQINDRMYAADFRDDYDDILCYGIAFFKKRCMHALL